MSSWAEYAKGTHTMLRIYLENGGDFLKYDNGDLRMTDKEDATIFYLLEHCSPADMRISYDLRLSPESEHSLISITAPTKNTQVNLSERNNDSDVYLFIKYHLNEQAGIKAISIFSENHTGGDEFKHYACDNYGGGRVVWWNLDTSDTGRTAKPNQIFNLVFT